MERSLYFKNYRNLGFKENEHIVLNHSLEEGKMGDLIIIIGENNSGKSNVLDGLAEFGAGRLDVERDRSTVHYEDEFQKPELILKVKDGEDIFFCNLMSNQISLGVSNSLKETNDSDNYKGFTSVKNVEALIKDLKLVYDYTKARYPGYGLNDRLAELISLLENNKKVNPSVILEKIIDMANWMKFNYTAFKGAWDHLYLNYRDHLFFKEMNSYLLGLVHGVKPANQNDKIKDLFYEKYGIKLLPKIVTYKEEKIGKDSMKTTINNLRTNTFFLTIFSVINISIDEINRAYNLCNTMNTSGPLQKTQKKINEGLERISNDFNKIYLLNNNGEKYRFEIALHTDYIYFNIYRNEDSLMIDYQSTGFRWFFNLYFNLLVRNTLEAGDILLMDEPATNLHVKGGQELREFLKEFAINNDISIILTTHDPFLINLDYLDELRVVQIGETCSEIKNDFSCIDINDPDSLSNVKNALTVSNHVILDPDRKVVFVEGITDYNYLIAFKKILKIKSEEKVFLPINGVGNVKSPDIKEFQKELSAKLIKIKKHNPMLLVDGDRAGRMMKKTNEDSELTVVSLKSIDENFTMIENLFSNEDQVKLGLVKEDGKFMKNFGLSSLMKNHIDMFEFDNETKNNFKKLFNILLED